MLELGDVRLIPPPLPGTPSPAVVAPASIRVWRRAIDGSTASCSGRVDVVDFEDYVKHVVPHEWIPSWQPESLKAGAMAARTYALSWIQKGGKYTCADVDDTTATQVYKDDTTDGGNAAADATKGQVIVDSLGRLVFAEYSAENGDPTADGVDDSVCAGKALNGHGRGMCQWGTQRWALQGKTYDWMVSHYYPGASINKGQPTKAELAATYLAGSTPPYEMYSGQTALAWVEYSNDGTTTWDTSRTQLGTTMPRDRPSPFFTRNNWLSDSRPTAVDSAVDISYYATGETARFTFVITAPAVDSDTTYTEHYGLYQVGSGWFGPSDDAVSFTVLVHPAQPDMPTMPPVTEPGPSAQDPQPDPGQTSSPDNPQPAAAGGGDDTSPDGSATGCAMTGAPRGGLDLGWILFAGVGLCLFRRRRA
jgi:hypothetical protein